MFSNHHNQEGPAHLGSQRYLCDPPKDGDHTKYLPNHDHQRRPRGQGTGFTYLCHKERPNPVFETRTSSITVMMASCVHQQWLRLHQDENGFLLNYGNRLHNIANSLPRPARQYPSLVFFIGKQSKTRGLRALFPGNGISNCRNYGIANVCLDPATTSSEYPILIANSCSEHTQLNPRGKDSCHEITSRQVAWPDEEDGRLTQQSLVDHVHARLLSLFIDVLCIFAQDCGGLDGVAEMLATWTTLGSASSLPGSVRPRLIIVTGVPGAVFNSEVFRFRLRVLSDLKFSESFSSLNVVNILGLNRPLSRDLFSGLGTIIQNEIITARLERIDTHTLFSMTHTAAFFDKALHNFAISPRNTFDFISYTREENPVSPNFQHHLESFMSLCSEHKLPEYILWDFVASAILLNAFPPDMHRRFHFHHQTLPGRLTTTKFLTHPKSSANSIAMPVSLPFMSLRAPYSCQAS